MRYLILAGMLALGCGAKVEEPKTRVEEPKKLTYAEAVTIYEGEMKELDRLNTMRAQNLSLEATAKKALIVKTTSEFRSKHAPNEQFTREQIQEAAEAAVNAPEFQRQVDGILKHRHEIQSKIDVQNERVSKAKANKEALAP